MTGKAFEAVNIDRKIGCALKLVQFDGATGQVSVLSAEHVAVLVLAKYTTPQVVAPSTAFRLC